MKNLTELKKKVEVIKKKLGLDMDNLILDLYK